MKRKMSILAGLLGSLLLMSACAGLQPPISAGPGAGQKTVSMEASSFSFKPNNIRAEQGDILTLNIDNVSGSAHNFTIKDPHGTVLQDVDLPSKKTVPVRITLSEPGVYEFYCDKPLHSTFGMKGRIEAAPASSVR